MGSSVEQGAGSRLHHPHTIEHFPARISGYAQQVADRLDLAAADVLMNQARALYAGNARGNPRASPEHFHSGPVLGPRLCVLFALRLREACGPFPGRLDLFVRNPQQPQFRGCIVVVVRRRGRAQQAAGYRFEVFPS